MSRPLVLGIVGVAVIGALTAIIRPWSKGKNPHSGAEAAVVARLPRTIAVLPFKIIGAGGNDEYLGLGMTDALITRLSHGRQIVVRPTSAVRRYIETQKDSITVGREQGVEAVLEGSVQLSGDRIRVTVQLLSTASGESIWANQFDERFTDIFAVQDSISQQVMLELTVELSPEERRRLKQRGTESIDAYQAYLKGLYFWNKRSKDGYKKAVEYFNQAIQIDPTYAQAYVGLGNAYAFAGGHDSISHAEAIGRQKAATKKALDFDDTLAEAHATLGLIAMNSEWDWPAAEKEFKRAIALNPNYSTAHQWYGEFLACMGRFDEGIAEVKRAHQLDPLSLIISTDLAKVYTFARRYDEAIEQYKRTLEMDPEFEIARGLLALTYSAKGMHEEAINELGKINNLENDPLYLSYRGFVYGKQGRRAEAQRSLDRMGELSRRTYVSPFSMAVAYSGMGDKEKAFQWLDQVFNERSTGGSISLKVWDGWDELRSDPRFPALMQRANL